MDTKSITIKACDFSGNCKYKYKQLSVKYGEIK